ncbi:hypothetical protein [Mycolicibacterium sp.]|uniref:hypothetical protein n=1 Tax=Mycolicibacterium sp. TaxID=2320850 RepID=UPI0028AEABBC|nr:hypothetical protein [Mycolicibacterium sp.]
MTKSANDAAAAAPIGMVPAASPRGAAAARATGGCAAGVTARPAVTGDGDQLCAGSQAAGLATTTGSGAAAIGAGSSVAAVHGSAGPAGATGPAAIGEWSGRRSEAMSAEAMSAEAMSAEACVRCAPRPGGGETGSAASSPDAVDGRIVAAGHRSVPASRSAPRAEAGLGARAVRCVAVLAGPAVSDVDALSLLSAKATAADCGPANESPTTNAAAPIRAAYLPTKPVPVSCP